jgi:hypothetical protein
METTKTDTLKAEHCKWLASHCLTLSYSRPCFTKACLQRAKLQGLKEGEAKCIPLELYNLLCTDKDSNATISTNQDTQKQFEATLENEKCTVNVTIGSQVTLCKMYGPRHFDDIRVTLNYEQCKWVIERKHDTYDTDSNYVSSQWIEVARIDGHEVEDVKMSNVKFYTRCPHGINITQCTLCEWIAPSLVDRIPLPDDGIAYTYNECQQHSQPCLCDGCLVYSLSAQRMKLFTTHLSRNV